MFKHREHFAAERSVLQLLSYQIADNAQIRCPLLLD